MALPQSDLVLKEIDPDEMTLDELCLFETGGFTAQGFRQFLIDHTEWTPREIGKLTVKELKAITEKLAEKVAAASVPNAN